MNPSTSLSLTPSRLRVAALSGAVAALTVVVGYRLANARPKASGG
jgi:hypothetical protein